MFIAAHVLGIPRIPPVVIIVRERSTSLGTTDLVRFSNDIYEVRCALATKPKLRHMSTLRCVHTREL